ncbi:MAG: hypothetical protein K2X27_15960 [Candidatus Obscuribacterales bacterium]|nr:hypothetical protein [Candidatus Obscuribacterales bacterium]
MSNILSASIEHLFHDRYLRRHQNDHPFPLDGSEWARLVSERLERARHPSCLCDGCLNFLSRLHGNKSLLDRERAGVRCAMHYWFLQGQSMYREKLGFSDEQSRENLWDEENSENYESRPHHAKRIFPQQFGKNN